MVRRSAKLLVEVLGTLVAGAAIFVAVVAWRLSSGPITLSLLTPYIEEALSAPDRGFTLKLDSTVLFWGGWARTFELKAIGVHIIDPTGQPLLTLPEMSLRLSARALVEGVVAPTSLEIKGAQVHLRRNPDGKFDLELANQSAPETTPNMLPVMLGDMLRRPDRGQPISFLRRIEITGADLVVEDSHWDTNWKAQMPRLILERDAAGVRADAVVDVHVEDGVTHFEASGLYSASSQGLSLEVAFSGLRPATFAPATEVLAPLAPLSLPFNGKVSAAITLDGRLDALRFDVSGGPGRLILPELYPSDLEIRRLSARGHVTKDGAAIVLEEGDVDLGGPTVTLSGETREQDGRRTVKLDLVGKSIAVDDLPALWPETVAVNPRRWITANLSSGAVDELYASIAAHGSGIEPKNLDIDKVNGTMRLSGISVLYIGKMPPVRGAAGEVRFDDKSFHISIDKGSVAGIDLDSGSVLIYGLEGEDHRIAIDLAAHGPLRKVLELIDSEPLRYAQALGVDPKKAAGDASVQLAFKFPLLHDLRLAQLEASASAEFKNVSMASMFLGHDLSRGNLKLKITKEGMEAAGDADIGPLPVTLTWDERFGKNTQRRIKLAGELSTKTQRAFGLDTGGLVDGPMHVALDLKASERGAAEVDVALDLAKARLTLPRVGWAKPPGIRGKAQLALRLSGERLAAVPAFTVEAGNLTAEGAVDFDPASGAFRTIRLDRLAFGRNRLAGAVTHRADGVYAAALRGEGLDATPLLKDDGPPPKEPGPKMAITLDVKKLWLTREVNIPLSDAVARIDYDGRRIAHAIFDAKSTSGAPVHLEIVPEEGKRKLAISTDNAGDLLKAVDFADNVVGGRLKIDGSYDDTKPDPSLAGTLRMSDFRLLQAPLVVKLLTVGSPTGMGDALSGEGVGFGSLVAPFTRTDARVEISKGYAVGSELGLTFEGWLDPDRNKLELEGTIAPIYTLNSLLGNIPGLGNILVGPKGSGMFAATYRATGKLDDPDVAVNPISALAPGIMRELVRGLFGSGSDLSAGDGKKPMQGGN